jgi:hypothetical protein
MPENVLDRLLSEELQASAGGHSTVSGLRLFLVHRREVQEVSEGLRLGTITPDAVRDFVAARMKDLRPRALFPHDVTLAALAVAMTQWNVPFADEYLREMATLKLAEMPLSPRVAEEVLTERSSGRSTTPPSSPLAAVAGTAEPAQPPR